ncbi:molybdate ABC transporter permease subunit [Kosmotoga pacifica]|uniref:Molybdenum transport system permease n=1 Tax=Kosmotoga pacifica TaxID=1330330 RepID=A0A0G2ZDL7_9BACT|nr:molybdate ABC transporter permease subunit [Kosmotoga pacifica]AKI97634.1 molybdenum ABC transporter permease [Kosmotoga pacifica]
MNFFRIFIITGIVFAILILILPLIALLLNTVTSEIHLEALMASWKPLGISLLTSTIATLIVFTVGVPVAYLFVFKAFPFRDVLDTLVNLPLVLPPSVAGYLLLLTFGRYGLVGRPLSVFGIEIMFSLPAVILAQTFVSLPFMVRSFKTALEEIPGELLEVSKITGANEYDIFIMIILPLAREGIISGVLLSFARAMGEFGATMMVAGLFETLPISIYNNAMAGDREAANLQSLVLVGFSLITLMLIKKLMERRD